MKTVKKILLFITAAVTLMCGNTAFAASININKIEDFSIQDMRKVNGSYQRYTVAHGKRYEIDYSIDAGTQIVLHAKLADGSYALLTNEGNTFDFVLVANAMKLKPILSGKRTLHILDSYRSKKTHKQEQVVTLEFYSYSKGTLTSIKSVTYGLDKLIEKKPSKKR